MKLKNSIISDYCNWNYTESAKEFLDKNEDIDVLQREGSFFYHAIDSNSTEMFNILLDYYIETPIQQ